MLSNWAGTPSPLIPHKDVYAHMYCLRIVGKKIQEEKYLEETCSDVTATISLFSKKENYKNHNKPLIECRLSGLCSGSLA